MSTQRKINAEPAAFTLTGFTVDELMLPAFVAELRKEFPTAVVPAIVIGFADSEDTILVAHDRKDRKYVAERVEVHGENPKQSATVLEVIKKVIA